MTRPNGMDMVRPPAVAGTFYPGGKEELDSIVRGFLSRARTSGPVPKALIAPHAGYPYSGPTAAEVYARLRPAAATIRKVVLMGPSHRVGFEGLALTGAHMYRTPLGDIPLDIELTRIAAQIDGVGVLEQAHSQEHSLEVHLPFLQEVLDDFTLLPVVAGDATPDVVARLLEAVWGGPETLIVISTDLSHFLDDTAAKTLDAATIRAVETFNYEDIGQEQACGRVPVKGLLKLAHDRGMTIETVDTCNSGNTTGDKSRVVGYGAWALTEAPFLKTHGPTLLRLAAQSILHGLRAKSPLPVKASDYASVLSKPGAAFVTLEKAGNLRGCIGSPLAWRPLLQDVPDNAFKAAFGDPRFPSLAESEIPEIDISVSVLTAPVPLPFEDREDLLSQMRPGIDGLILTDQGRRGLFLPQVWESLATAEQFLAHLVQKAGLPAGHWSDTVTLQRFEANAVKSRELDEPEGIWA